MKCARHGRLRLALTVCTLILSTSCAGADANGDLRAMAKGKKAVVLVFIATDCPISNAYAPELRRIETGCTARNVAFVLVYSEPDLTRENARRHAKEYGYACPWVLDPTRRLARRAGATVTPEAAVFAPDGRLLYRGRIDDAYVGYGKRRFRATRHDLRDVLDAVSSGRPMRLRTTMAVGCFI